MAVQSKSDPVTRRIFTVGPSGNPFTCKTLELAVPRVILKLLESPDPKNRREGIATLGQLPNDDATHTALRTLTLIATYEEVRAAAEALPAKIRRRAARQQLINAACNSENSAERLDAVEKLSEDPNALIQVACESVYTDIRFKAVELLAVGEPEDTIMGLLKIAESAYPGSAARARELLRLPDV